MEAAGTCVYEHEYTDTLTGRLKPYKCGRLPHADGKYCVLHTGLDATAAASDDEVIDAFMWELKAGMGANADEPMLFVGCQLPRISIEGTNTTRPMHFNGAKFKGGAEFIDVECRAVDCTGAEFAGPLQMQGVKAESLSLRKIRFTGPHDKFPGGEEASAVEISRCNFKRYDMILADLPSTRLSECRIVEARSKFAKIGQFVVTDCEFDGNADFSDCRFARALFLATALGPVTFESTKFEVHGQFTRVHFKRQELTRFCRRLSNVRLRHTDVTRVKFSSDAAWNDDGDPYCIVNEREFVKGLWEWSLSDTLATYRILRDSHEYWLMYTEAGRFYVREMDLKRMYRQDVHSGRVTRSRLNGHLSLIGGYNLLCRYGEGLDRALASMAILFTASTAYFFLFPEEAAHEDTLSRIVAASERTLAAFFHMGRAEVADFAVRIASLPVLGSLFIVLRRRLERKFRH